jgi:hypothetical protein
MTEVQPPYVLQNASHGAELFRQAISTLLDPAGGTVGVGGLLVSPHVAPNMSVNILGGTPEQGGIWIPGTSLPDTQGLYYCRNDATVNRVIGPADAALPRIERVIAVVKDEAVAGVGNEWHLEPVPGVPTAGAKLNDRKGEAAAPASSLTLAHVLIPAKAVAIGAEDIMNVAKPIGGTVRQEVGTPPSFMSWGQFEAGGAVINGGTGDFTLTHPGEGHYVIKWNTPKPNADYSFIATPHGNGAIAWSLVVEITAEEVNIHLIDVETKKEIDGGPTSFVAIASA